MVAQYGFSDMGYWDSINSRYGVPIVSPKTGKWALTPEQEAAYAPEIERYAQEYPKGDNARLSYLNKLARVGGVGQSNLAASQNYIDTKWDKKFKPGKAIAGLAGGVVGAGMGAALAPALLGAGTAGAAGGLSPAAMNLAGQGALYSLPSGVASAAGSGLSQAAMNLGSKGSLYSLPQAAAAPASGGLGSALSRAGKTALDYGTSMFGKPAETIAWNQGGNSILNAGSGIRGAMSGGGLSALTKGTVSAPRLGTSLATNAFSAYRTNQAQKDMEKQILAGNRRAEEALMPYSQMGLDAQRQYMDSISAGFDPSQLENDAGYQFRLAEGQKALDRQLASQGMGQSGAAIKASQDYAQGQAAQQYNDAYQQWLQQQAALAGIGQQGLSTAGALGGLYQQSGMVGAQRLGARQELENQTIARILAGF